MPRRITLLVALALLGLGLGCERVYTAVPADAWDRLFERTDGWTGADGAYSVELSPGRTLFVFGDSWIGPVRDGRHVDASLVNNSIGILDHRGADAPDPDAIRFYWGPDGEDSKPTAWLTPDPAVFPDAEGSWFWPGAAVHLPGLGDGRLVMFVVRQRRRGADDIFDFQPVDSGVVLVDRPATSPTEWARRQFRLPFEHPGRQVTWGVAAALEGDEVYVFGVDDRDPEDKQLLIARVHASRVSDPSGWRFRDARGGWSATPADAAPIVGQLANELSVHPNGDRWIMLYSASGFDDRVLMRHAARPEGPWTTATTLFQVPDLDADAQHFTYAAKAHPQLGERGLLFTYVVNSLDFGTMAADADIYRPRFVRLPDSALPGR